MTTNSLAGPGEGVERPDSVNILNIREHEESHGSPLGERGIIVLWDGDEYDSDESWIMCPREMVCNLGYWQ